MAKVTHVCDYCGGWTEENRVKPADSMLGDSWTETALRLEDGFHGETRDICIMCWILKY